MTDPVTIFTASAIADLAFREFIKSGAGEVAKKFTAEAIAKMNDLRKMIGCAAIPNSECNQRYKKAQCVYWQGFCDENCQLSN